MDKKKNDPEKKAKKTSEQIEENENSAPVSEADAKEADAAPADKNSREAELESELAEAISMAQRLQAEFDNYRKRNAKLRAEALDEGAENVMKALLDTLDSFERAMESKPEDTSDPFVQGIALVYKQMRDALSKLGLSEIDSNGQFDPNFHDAVMQDDSGEHESGTVTQVLQKGYKVNDRVIRHAMVKVAI